MGIEPEFNFNKCLLIDNVSSETGVQVGRCLWLLPVDDWSHHARLWLAVSESRA